MTTPPDPAVARAMMSRAIELSIEAVETGLGGPFGAVVVKDGQVIATGQNRVTSAHDPTAHAEVVAIREACRVLGAHSLAGHEIFSSCEPCPMCLAAIHWARLDRLTFAATREDAAGAGFDDELLYRELILPPEQRSIPTLRAGRDEALEAFARWDAKEDRVQY